MDPRLVILSRGPGLYSTTRLMEESQRYGFSTRIIDPMSITTAVDGEVDGFITRAGLLRLMQ